MGIASQMPPQEDDAARKQRDLERQVREQASAKTGQAMQIGAGGLLINDGGSLTIQGTGQFNTNGAINTTGSISASTTVTAGTSITAGGTITSTSGNIFALAGTVSAAALTASGLISGGGVSTTGNVGAGGSVSGATGTFNSGLFSTAVFSTIVAGTRSATWTENTGTIGTAPSSIRFKTNVVDADWSESRVLAVLEASSKYYNYKSEVAKRDDPKSPDYVGPHYHVHQEIGYIAEELHAAGLWEFVVYERDMVTKTEKVDVPVDTSVGRGTMSQAVEVVQGDTLRLDKNGEPIPLSIHYGMLSVAAIEAAKWLWGRVQSLESDMAAVKAHLGL